MAIDLWLLEQHCQGLHPSALRFYTWTPPAISLGYHQRHWSESWRHLCWRGIPLQLVRRPTGGRAVLHQGDLTYAVVTSGLKGNRTKAYQTLCEFLVQGWRSLGLELRYGHAGRGYIHNPNCFGTATGADLVLSTGAKFIGSAQLRRGSAILQHGSMRLEQDADLFRQVFGTELDAIDLPAKLQQENLISTVVEALTAAARDYFGVHLITQPLSEAEWQAVLAQPSLTVG